MLSKLDILQNRRGDAAIPDNNSDDEGNTDSLRYVPLCSCRRRELEYAKIKYAPDGPHYDEDVFKILQKVYRQGRGGLLGRLVSFWLFDVKEVRPVEVTTATIDLMGSSTFSKVTRTIRLESYAKLNGIIIRLNQRYTLCYSMTLGSVGTNLCITGSACQNIPNKLQMQFGGTHSRASISSIPPWRSIVSLEYWL